MTSDTRVLKVSRVRLYLTLSLFRLNERLLAGVRIVIDQNHNPSIKRRAQAWRKTRKQPRSINVEKTNPTCAAASLLQQHCHQRALL